MAIDDGWRQWVAENLLRDCSPPSMLATMVAAGLPAEESAAAIVRMQDEPAFRAARRFQELQRKLESVNSNLQQLWETDPAYTTVEKRAGIPHEEFMARYVRGCRPVVITDIANDWPAMKRWSPQDLKQRFGMHQVEIQDGRESDPKFEENKLAHRKVVPLADFVDRVVNGGPTNDCYMTANNELIIRPEFAALMDDIGTLPAICDRSLLRSLSWFWFGPAGTNTPLHHDTVMLFHTQVVGRKRWRFISPLDTPRVYNFNGVFSPIDLDKPDFERYPAFRGVKVLEVVAEPGDTVFLPLGWWHQVTALDVTISYSYTNLRLHNDYKYANPTMTNW